MRNNLFLQTSVNDAFFSNEISQSSNNVCLKRFEGNVVLAAPIHEICLNF